MPTRRKKSSAGGKGKRTAAKRTASKRKTSKRTATKRTATKRMTAKASAGKKKSSAKKRSSGRKTTRAKQPARSRRSAPIGNVKETAMKVLAGADAGAVPAVNPPLEEVAGKSDETAGIDRGGWEPGTSAE